MRQVWRRRVRRMRVFVGPRRVLTIEGVEPMGRGRAKAKQTKVARQLKYSSGGTDLERLQAELAAERGGEAPSSVSDDGEDDDYDLDHDDDDV